MHLLLKEDPGLNKPAFGYCSGVMAMLLIIFSVLHGLLALLITSANTLIILVFSRATLRKRSNILLVGLAVVDLMVGSLAVPLWIASYLSPSNVSLFYHGRYVDLITSLTSLFTLAVISLERLYAVCWPFHHRTLSRRAYVFAACLPWILVSVVTFTAKLAHHYHYTRILVSSTLLLPPVIICSAYFVIWKKQPATLPEAQERKLAKTILILVGAFDHALMALMCQLYYIVS